MSGRSAKRKVLNGLLMIVISLMSLRHAAGQTSTKVPNNPNRNWCSKLGTLTSKRLFLIRKAGYWRRPVGAKIEPSSFGKWHRPPIRTLAGHQAGIKSGL